MEGEVLFSSLRKHRRAQAHGGAVETMHLKPGAQEQDYFLYLSAFENSPWGELNPGQSEVVRVLYKPIPSLHLQPVQEKSIF